MTKLRIEINVPGFNAVRRSQAVMDDLLTRGMAIQDATGSPGDFEVIESPTSTRARVVVVTATQNGRRLEATDRVLTRAFNAARG